MEFENETGSDKLVFAAGVCSEHAGDREEEIRRYAIGLLQGFFASKGRELKTADYRLVLNRVFSHIHRHIAEELQEEAIGMDLALVIANASKAYGARCGKGDLYLFHEGEAQSVFKKEGDDSSLLGMSTWEGVELDETSLQPGDIIVLCNPAVARVIKVRDITLILRRASEPTKASLFLSAIAERKGASGILAALIWSIPNYQGAAMLTEETPPSLQEETGEIKGDQLQGPEEEFDQAEQVKRHWLNLWKRRKA